MPEPAFVGREPELRQLLDLVGAAAAGQGGTLFVSGDAGMGKQALVDELARRAGGDVTFVTGRCQREHEGQNPYEPFAEILVGLVATGREEKARRAVVEVLKETAPDWLGMIPVVGAGLGAGMKTALRLREAYREEAGEERERLAQDRAAQFLGALTSRLERGPVVLVVTQAQWIDGSSAGLLERVAHFATEQPVAAVVLSRPVDDAGDEHPLQAVEDELVIGGLATQIDLAGLGAEGVVALVRAERGKELATDVAAWLREFTDGNPMFVANLFPVLEDSGILVEREGVYVFHDDVTADGRALSLGGRLSKIVLPPSVTRAVARRLAGLEGDDRELLEIASVEGRRFLSSTLARVAEVEERELLRTLGDVEKRHGLIRSEPVVQRRRYAYEFTNVLLQQQIYAGLSEPERVEYHCAVAEALVASFGEEAPRPVLLDIARHFEEGCDPGTAVWYLLRAAESAVLDGAAPNAAALCRRGLALAREAGEEPDPLLDRTRAELVQLLVTASDDAWVAEGGVEELVAEGRRAAERVGDDELLARLLYAEGRVLVTTRDVAAARRTYEEAVALAGRAAEAGQEGAALTRLSIMIELGNTLDIDDLGAGLAVLREALALFLAHLQPAAGEPEPAEARLFHRLEGFIGIAEMDRGNLGEARRLLDSAVEGLTRLARRSDLPRLLNYRAQAALARGDFAAAQADAEQALEGAAPGPWASYNRAFLGKIALDAGRYEDAGGLLRAAWGEFQARWLLSLGLVARAYLAEYLLRPGSPAAEVEEAAALVADELRDATEGRYTYCVAWAESLAAEVALRRGDPDAAVGHARRAVEVLDAAGDLPIVRTEEVLWRYARCLEAAGSPEAAAVRDRARAVVERKAATLPAPEAARMLEVTPTARAMGLATGRPATAP